MIQKIVIITVKLYLPEKTSTKGGSDKINLYFTNAFTINFHKITQGTFQYYKGLYVLFFKVACLESNN